MARRGRLNRGVFDAAQLSLAAGAGASVFHAVGAADWGADRPDRPRGRRRRRLHGREQRPALPRDEPGGRLELPRGLAGALPLADPVLPLRGPARTGAHVAYEKIGVTGLLAFTLPPAAMMFSVRQYVSRTRQSVEEVRAANDELKAANVQLAARNDDLQALFHFAGGLSARAHDRGSLTAYAEDALTRLTGARGEDRARRRARAASTSSPAAAGSAACTSTRTPARGRALESPSRCDPPPARDRDRERRAHRRGPEEARRDGRRARALDGGEGLLHRRPHGARLRHRRRPGRATRLRGPRARRGRDRRPPARHRQDRHPGAHPPQARPPRRRGVEGDEGAPGDLRVHPPGGRPRPDRAPDRPLEPRAHGRQGLSGRQGRRRDPDAGADRPRRRRVRRADERPPLPLGPRGRRPRWRSSAPMPAASSARR